jgi:hypothetical protein
LRLAQSFGHLRIVIIFDRRSEDKKLPWEQRITWRTEGEVSIVGC